MEAPFWLSDRFVLPHSTHSDISVRPKMSYRRRWEWSLSLKDIVLLFDCPVCLVFDQAWFQL